MDIKDVAGLSKPLEKAITAIQAAIGTWYEPKRIVKKAKAEAEAVIICTEAEIERNEMLKRAALRMGYIELKRQQNIENIANKALVELPKDVKDTPPDTDWIIQFFENCKDVSNEELQLIWARLLAGEIASPGIFARRTLDSLKLMSINDAKLFNAFCRTILKERGVYCQIEVYESKEIDKYLKTQGLDLINMSHLETIGLINLSLGISIKLKKEDVINIDYFGQKYVLKKENTKTEDKYSDNSLRIITLTSIGSELFKITKTNQDNDYLNLLKDALFKEGFVIQKDLRVENK